jgi:hypothetical protein
MGFQRRLEALYEEPPLHTVTLVSQPQYRHRRHRHQHHP